MYSKIIYTFIGLIWFIFEIILASICGASIINSIIVTALTSAGLRSQPIENDQVIRKSFLFCFVFRFTLLWSLYSHYHRPMQ